MVKASIVGPSGGEVVPLGPTTMRILEDGGTTGHRLGIGEITVAPHSDGPPSTGTPGTTRAFTSSPAPPGSRSARRHTTRRPAPWR
jgi:hypothetical protein